MSERVKPMDARPQGRMVYVGGGYRLEWKDVSFLGGARFVRTVGEPKEDGTVAIFTEKGKQIVVLADHPVLAALIANRAALRAQDAADRAADTRPRVDRGPSEDEEIRRGLAAINRREYGSADYVAPAPAEAQSAEAPAETISAEAPASDPIPAEAIAAYRRYHGSANAAWEAGDEAAWASINHYAPSIEAAERNQK